MLEQSIKFNQLLGKSLFASANFIFADMLFISLDADISCTLHFFIWGIHVVHFITITCGISLLIGNIVQ